MKVREAANGRLEHAFRRARDQGRLALVTYLTAGYPSLEATLDLVPALVRAGADVIELGVPFSDPIADGPIIQRAAYEALQQGVTPQDCLRVAECLRKGGLEVPLLFMGYYNPILAWGPAAYARACREAGADGLIVPDLPLEEAEELDGACQGQSLALIYLVAPGTPATRLARIARKARGFLYLVSRAGITGPRDSLPAGLPEYVARVRRHCDLPLALGFGIGEPVQVRELHGLVDAAVVGSAIVERAVQGAEAVERFARGLAEAAKGCA